MPLTARISLCAEPSVRVPLRSLRALAHLRVERVDLERILADEPRLQRQHLLLHADAGRAVGFGDAVDAGVGHDLDQRVGAAAPCITITCTSRIFTRFRSAAASSQRTGGRRAPTARQRRRGETAVVRSRGMWSWRSYQYSFRPSCMRRGLLSCVEMTPNVLLLKSVSGAPQTMRLNRIEHLDAEVHIEASVHLDRLGDAHVLVQIPGPSHIAVDARCVSKQRRPAARMPRDRETCRRVGSNESPAIGARQSAPVTFGRFVPLKIGSGALRGDADREAAGVGLNSRDAPSAEDLIRPPVLQPAPAAAKWQFVDRVDLDACASGRDGRPTIRVRDGRRPASRRCR